MSKKDNRTILNAVRVGKTVFKSGEEDELSSALSQTDLDRLNDQGALGGDWTSTFQAEAEETPAEPAKGKK